MKTLLSRLLVAALLAALAACAGLPGRVEPPAVTLADVGLIDAGLFEQRFLLKLRIQNPNAFDLPIEALTYDVEVNGLPFARGVASRPVRVPRYGSTLMEVEAVSNLASLARQLRGLERSGGGLDYRIKGKLNAGWGHTELPFDHRGQVSLFGSGKDGAPRDKGI